MLGIISLYYQNKNYGGLLQSYAMAKAVEQEGIPCQHICISNAVPLSQDLQGLLAHDEKGLQLLGVLFQRIAGKVTQRNARKKVASMVVPREAKFTAFEKDIPHSETVYAANTISDAADKYDAFLCGSDQIWNMGYSRMNIYALGFAPDNVNKISYAASLGGNEKPQKTLDALHANVSRLDHISVREKTALEVFPEDTRKRMEVVLDPTLLLTADQWKEATVPYPIDEPYIFCYFLGTSPESRLAAEKMAAKWGMKIVTSPYILGRYEACDEHFGDVRLFDAGPREFLSLIQNAELVLTDSFHACVFSMLFGKQFYVFERKQSGGGSMHSRITDFLETFCLQDRLLTPETALKAEGTIDFTIPYRVLDGLREQSRTFLRNALTEASH